LRLLSAAVPLAALTLLAGGGPHAAAPLAPPRPVPASAGPRPPARWAWAERTLARLTLPEKVAQMIGIRAFGLYQNRRSKDFQKLLDQVRRLKVGCVVVFESEVESLPRLLNELQAAAGVPILVAADMERGLAQRIRRGVVPLPHAMAVGATGSEEAARFTGQVAAREGRALGVHWAFAPVADVNNNPANPVINIRSYGEDPELVGRLSAAFVRGAHEGGLMTTVKHFPGHGDTAVDSHLQLASVDADRARLNLVELSPFRQAVAAGVDAVMLGHIAVKALDPSGTPATLSGLVTTDLLRGELGFQGLIVTDAMEMQGVRAAWTGEAAIRAVSAGADLILLPPDPQVAIQALVGAVREGQLTEARIDASVRRILEAKERLGLHLGAKVDVAAISANVGRPEDVEGALEVARRSITVVRNTGDVIPLRAEEPLRILHLVLSSDARNDAIAGIPEDELALRRIPTFTMNLGPEVSPETTERILEMAPGFTHVLASCFVRVSAFKGTASMSESHARLLRAVLGAGRPVVMLSFGSPYLLQQVPEAPVYVAAYGGSDSSQRAAVGALFGEYPVSGKLPVTLPGLYALRHGLELPRREMTLRDGRAEDVGFRPGGLAALDGVLDKAVADKASRAPWRRSAGRARSCTSSPSGA
jgi:beta-glucosidase-like glycosyl hydrolase